MEAQRPGQRRPVPALSTTHVGGEHPLLPPAGPEGPRGALVPPDVLVFRRLSATRWAHLGGQGRGASWAGVVDLGPDDLAHLAADLAAGKVVRGSAEVAEHVVGPYWARTWAVVPVEHDHVVVLGSPTRDETLAGAPEADLRQAAASAVETAAEVSPAKRLADELEVLQALEQLGDAACADLGTLLEQIAQVAATATQCELAAVVIGPNRFVTVQRGWALPGSSRDLAAVLRACLVPDAGVVVAQDARARPLPHPVGPGDGVVSWLAASLPMEQGEGWLFLAHTDDEARGFTDLCQALAGRLAERAAGMLRQAVARQRLEDQLDASRRVAALDPLTGLANRRSWDEGLRAAQEVADTGHHVTVVTVDIDNLKAVNDGQGHQAGDALIARCAAALRRCVRGDRDVVARLGGDEFGLLLPDVSASAAVVARLRHELTSSRDGGPQLSASVGAATCPPYGSVVDAYGRADRAMYDDKELRRRGA